MKAIAPAVTLDHLRLAGDSDAVLWSAWVAAVAALPDDPWGAEVHRFGNATGLFVHAVPLAYYNRVIGLRGADAREVPRIASFYRQRQTPCRIDINPLDASPELLSALIDHGFHPAAFQTNLYGYPEVEGRARPGVRIRAVKPSELHFFAELYERAYHHERSSPRLLRRFRMDSIKARIGHSGWRFYLTTIDGVPAGGAAMYIQDEVATLAGGATIFTLRGRGAQKALLQRRLSDASKAGCGLVVSRCDVGSISQMNMERAGLRTAYTKTIWEHRPA